jgi:uncharacterized membrane protein
MISQKHYQRIIAITAIFIGLIVAIAVNSNSYILASVGIVTGMLFLTLIKSRVKVLIDERGKTIREKAAQITYAIFAPTIGIGSFLLLMPSHSGLSVFAKGEFLYLESLGTILAYLTLFLISLYAISYFFLNRKYGGGSDEE